MRKKVLIIAISIIMFCVLACSQGVTYAATAATPLYLGVTRLMSNNEVDIGGENKSYFGYAIGDPNANGSTTNSIVAAPIWNIVKYSSETSNSPIDSSIFCVKAGVGFSDTAKRETYNIFYDMKTEKEAIRAQNDTLKSIVEGDIALADGTKISKYNAILAILDNFYIKGESSIEEKDALLEAAGISNEEYSYLLNEDDVKAVQQAALWYFTNYGDSVYDKTSNTGWLNYSTDGNSYTSLSDFKRWDTNEGLERQQQAEILYNYLIKTAEKNAANYATETSTTSPIKVNTSTLDYETEGDNYIVGPINMTASENSIPYTISLAIKNGSTDITSYSLLDQNKRKTDKTVKDLVGNNFYISIPKSSVTISNLNIGIDINYSTTKLTLWGSSTNNLAQPVVIPEKKSETVSVKLTPPSKKFDLALRKYITKVNGEELTGSNSRVPNIDESTLKTGTTATYKHRKDPITVETGSIVTYKMTIYNEGEKAGRATKVIDQLPTGLKFKDVVSGNFELGAYNQTDNTLTLIRKDDNNNNLNAYTEGKLDSETIEIECEVTADSDSSNKVLTNVAWIAEEIDGESNITITNQNGADRDSEPSTTPSVNKDNMSDYIGNNNKSDLTDSNYYYKGQQDDDDFEKLILMPDTFDLKLIKRIVAVNNQNVPERIESVDVSKLNTVDENGKLITTGDYKLNKDPVGVKKGDIVTYTFRIYNEGTMDGYASEITEDIPAGLQFLWSEKEGEELQNDTTLTDEEKEAIEFNQKYLWGKFVYDDKKENIVQISSEYLSKENETTEGANLIKAFGKNDGTKTEADISYKELSVKLKVVSEDQAGSIIRNEAEISEDTDKDGNSVDDRDSDTDKWVKYEDDEDYDNIILQSFDLALRKFIIAVSDDTTIADNEYLKNEDGSYKRAPVVDTSKLNTEDENGKLITTAIYNHTKEPILVKQNDIIVYMLRVYNEGDMDGYASEIKDHLPPYLEFVDGDFNKKYGWSASEDGRTITTKYLENSKITKATKNSDGKYVLAYKEVPIMCKVKDTAKSNEKITNIADITEYLDENKNKVTDRDSQPDNVVLPSDENLPSYKDDESGDYIPGQQDDDDFEKVIVKTFDLALRKWVTQAIVIENGKQSVTNTGHDAWDDPEQIVKVELHRKKLNQVTVKFRYSIRVYNQGDVEGYAKEITDYIPEGLKFVAEDNPGWTDEGNNVISTTLLKDTLLKPGEYADVEVLLTWINSQDNMGVKVNTAEISKDYNEYGLPDKDSTPDNRKQGEDDIDDAPVMLSVSTGQVRIYFTIGFVVLITIAGGVVLIKKYVL